MSPVEASVHHGKELRGRVERPLPVSGAEEGARDSSVTPELSLFRVGLLCWVGIGKVGDGHAGVKTRMTLG